MTPCFTAEQLLPSLFGVLGGCLGACDILWQMWHSIKLERCRPEEHKGQNVVAQDERELKRQRRKQSNRESARRSRLRKQAECEGLGQKVLDLEAENIKLKETIAVLQAQLDAALGKTTAAAPAASQPAS